jgi:hypothetical protein
MLGRDCSCLNIALFGLRADPASLFSHSWPLFVYWLRLVSNKRQEPRRRGRSEVHDLHPAETLRSWEKSKGMDKDSYTSSSSSERLCSIYW